MKLLRELDPEGTKIRRRRRILRRTYHSIGPNQIWHVVGYDKLKPYGFAIHGCIDGYSRKLMWLQEGPSNNDPAIVASNYVECVQNMKGCPLILQADPGTENITMGALHCLFRHDAADDFAGLSSFRVSRSDFNQRIEAWWSLFRRRKSQWWMHFFKDLELMGVIHRGIINEIYSLRYCFMPVLQLELSQIVEEWNTHFISHSRVAQCPNGRPDILHSLGGQDCLQPINEDDIALALNEVKS
ncbi:uncharacterized protein LOC133180064 [Saccostrea echinata]|uniref:uncharacterized protein LOC133180064 n=1 Tax=Saccostrea echinata TaxID=191078 RepID=UPI002A8367B9|nr:uncharacterized protein LOC133180064 [Saccostrea echinata]